MEKRVFRIVIFLFSSLFSNVCSSIKKVGNIFPVLLFVKKNLTIFLL